MTKLNKADVDLLVVRFNKLQFKKWRLQRIAPRKRTQYEKQDLKETITCLKIIRQWLYGKSYSDMIYDAGGLVGHK
ncbi:MAG: hypothetical protein V4547_16240 [Bacteroidota bacterium]